MKYLLKIIVTLLCITTFISCCNNQRSHTSIIHNDIKVDVHNAIYASPEHINDIFKDTVARQDGDINFADGQLAYVDYYFLMDYIKAYQQLKQENNVTVWNRVFDCDDFAQLFVAYAKVKNRHASVHDKSYDGLAIGEIWYRRASNDECHAINVVLLGFANVIFIEPQTGEVVKLTEKEVKSIYFIRF